MDEAAVVELARAQYGLVTRAQVLGAGGSDDAVLARIGTGRWSRQRRGVYVVGGAPACWEQAVLGACLAAGTDAVASHRTAARLWGLVERSGRTEVLVGADRRVRLAGVTVRRTGLLPPADGTVLRGIPVTTLARTIVDASVGQPADTVGLWIDEGVRRRELRLADLRRSVARLTRPGRADLSVIRGELARRLPGYDPGDSELEVRALRVLRSAGLPAPVQQRPVRLGDGHVAYLDLAYPDDRIAVELDGWDVHRTRRAFDRDRSRANRLALLGWEVYRFTSTTTDAELAATVAHALERSAARRAALAPTGSAPQRVQELGQETDN